jgi:phage tail sheath protein FI
MAGRLSNLSPEQSSLNKPIYGIAGTQKSGFGSLNAFYSVADLNTLELNGIDVITNPGAGLLPIWTARFGHNSSTNITLHLDNYTTLTNYVAKTLEGGLGYYIGTPISQQLFGNITATLTQFLQNLTGAGLLVTPDGSIPYGVQCNISNNPPSQTNLGIVQANVQAVFPSILEKFLVNLQGGNTVTVTVITPNS